MKLARFAFSLMSCGLAVTACRTMPTGRPANCAKFDLSSFEPLDANHDGYLSDSEFQVHRNQMHGPGVPQECHIPYDKGSYERLAGSRGMSKEEFKVHLQEMERRAALGNVAP